MSRGVFLYKGKPYNFGKLDDKLARVKRTMPPVLAQVAVNHFKDSFQDQGFTDRTLQRWPKRKGNSRRDTGRAILVKSADLRNSIHPAKVSFHITEISTDKPYARVHNEGYHGPAKVRSHVRRSRGGKSSRVRAHTRQMDMPQRQFMGNSVIMENEIERIIDRTVTRCFG